MDMAILHPLVAHLDPRSLVNVMMVSKTHYAIIKPNVTSLVAKYISSRFPTIAMIFDTFHISVHNIIFESHIDIFALSDLLIEIDTIYDLKKGAKYKQRTRALFERLIPNVDLTDTRPRVQALTIRILLCITLYLKTDDRLKMAARRLTPWGMLALVQYIAGILFVIIDDITPAFEAGLRLICDARTIRQMKFGGLDDLGKIQLQNAVCYILDSLSQDAQFL